MSGSTRRENKKSNQQFSYHLLSTWFYWYSDKTPVFKCYSRKTGEGRGGSNRRIDVTAGTSVKQAYLTFVNSVQEASYSQPGHCGISQGLLYQCDWEDSGPGRLPACIFESSEPSCGSERQSHSPVVTQKRKMRANLETSSANSSGTNFQAKNL